ncbi:MAG TPA: hypothetical protein VLM37_06520 [Fibrobacteraceae bacterium]|nr:hypothetical protein [Fibrobacteraceae bacterium]
MFKVSSDIAKNRLLIVLSGSMDLEETEEVLMLIQMEIARLHPPFDVITDIRHLRQEKQPLSHHIVEGMDLLFQNGAGRLVRVVGASREGLLVFAAQSRKRPDYACCYVSTIENAENALEARDQ